MLSPITIKPISGAVGAVLSGVDLGTDLSDEEIATIRQALLDHGVIFFHDQDFDANQHKRLARRFGDIFNHPFLISEDPDIVTIVRNPGDKRIVGEDWHSDTTMMPEPPMELSLSHSMYQIMVATLYLPVSISPTKRCRTA